LTIALKTASEYQPSKAAAPEISEPEPRKPCGWTYNWFLNQFVEIPRISIILRVLSLLVKAGKKK
jgi:hypothetical protein